MRCHRFASCALRALSSTVMRKSWPAAILFLLLTACMPGEIPKQSLEFAEEKPARRRAESRSFDTSDETKLLTSSAAVLKELGFTVDVRSDDLGVLAASKKGTDYNIGDIATAAATTLLSQVTGIGSGTAFSKDQSMRASVVTRPAATPGALVLRVTLQRVLWEHDGTYSKSELVTDPAVYAEFFAKLAKAAGVEAHEV